MSALHRTLRLDVRGRRRRPLRTSPQGGYALIGVLAVIAVTSVMIGALMGLLLTTMRAAESSKRATDELRAMDSAVEAAINQMRYDPSSSGASACGVEPPVQRVEQIAFDQGSAGTGDDITVDVECRRGIVTTETASTADQVRLVGKQGYGGEIGAAWNTFGWPVGTSLTGVRPNLVHTGPQPLRFNSGVTVRNGAAVLRSPDASPAVVAAGEYTQGSPGIGAAAGQPCGLLATAASPARIVDLDGTGEPECDSPDARAVDPSPTDPIAGFSKPTTPPPRPVTNNCSDFVAEIQPGRYNPTDTDRLLQRINATATGAASSCGDKSVTFHFQPGIYYFEGKDLVFDRQRGYFVAGAPKGWSASDGVEASSTARRNPQAELCDPDVSGVTFVMSPGQQLRHLSGRFDMCAAFSPVAGQPRLPAIYQETSSNAGVDVLQQPWTRTANCATTGQGSRDLVEPAILSARWQASRFEIPSLPDGQCRNARTHSVALSVPDESATLTSAKVLVTGYENKSTPSNLISNRFTMISVLNSAGQRLCTTTAQSGVANGKWSNTVDLMTGSCASPRTNGPITVGADVGKTPDPRFPDLAGPNTSGTSLFRKEVALTNRDQLKGATLEITQFLTFSTLLLPLEQQLTIDDVQVHLNSFSATVDPAKVTSSAASPATPFSKVWNNPAGVADASGPAPPDMPCRYLLCHVPVPADTRPTRPFVHELQLDDLSMPIPAVYVTNGIDPNISALHVALSLDPNLCPTEPGGRCQFPPNALFEDLGLGIPDVNAWLKNSFFGSEMTVRIDIETAVGKRCSETAGFSNSAQVLAFDLLDSTAPPSSTDCSGVISSFSELADADLMVRFSMPCMRNWIGNTPWQCMSTGSGASYHVFQVRPPSLTKVQLVAETDTYAGAQARSTVTINATTAQNGDSFNVSGRVWMPVGSLDIDWKGDVTEGRPLISDDLVVHSLGSRIAAAAPSRANDARYAPEDRYVVCCADRQAESRRVRLIATVGERRLEVEVLFIDVVEPPSGPTQYSPGHAVQITGWQTCDSGRCGTGPSPEVLGTTTVPATTTTVPGG